MYNECTTFVTSYNVLERKGFSISTFLLNDDRFPDQRQIPKGIVGVCLSRFLD